MMTMVITRNATRLTFESILRDTMISKRHRYTPGAERQLPPVLCENKKRRGSLLLEAIIAIGVFAFFLGGIGMSLILGERSTVSGGDRARGAFIAEQQLEATRMLRKQSFDALTVGTHGIAQTGTGWKFSGTSVTTNGYTSNIVISSHATDWIDVQSNVTWNFGPNRSGALVLNTSLTNWRKVIPIGNWAAMSRIGLLAVSGTPNFQDVIVSGNYAYVTSTHASGGKGLYIFDITNPASPVRVDTAFDLGVGAYRLAAESNRLYLTTDSATQEVQVYDITSPATLAIGNMVNSYDLPGSGKARSVAIYGSNIFVGTLDDPPNKQLYSLLMSETGPMTLQSSLALSGSVLGLSLKDGYAYAATSYNAGELQVVDIFDPANIVFAPGGGIDLTDVQDGNIIATFGTSALIGRLNGSTISELTLYSIADAAVPSPPPGPWTLEIGGDVTGLANAFGSKYSFVASNNNNTQIQVLDMNKFSNAQAPVVQTYNTHANMTGLFYDWQHDRLYAISTDSLFVFAPG